MILTAKKWRGITKEFQKAGPIIFQYLQLIETIMNLIMKLAAAITRDSEKQNRNITRIKLWA